MRRSPFILLGFASVLFLPLTTHAFTLTPIIPLGQCAGTAPDWGSVMAIFQIGINDLVAVATILITIYIAWAGFAFMLAPVNPEAKTKARTRIVNAVLGLLVALGAWLLVNTLMATIYSTAFDNGVSWNQILADGGDQCIVTRANPPSLPGLVTSMLASGNPNASGAIGGAGNNNSPLSTGGGGACSASNVQSQAAQEGVTISNTDANELACVAKYESSCGAVNQNYKWGQGSSAYGAFQVTLSGNSGCYDNAACEKSVGASGPLNCSTGFQNGNPIPGSQTAATCQRAAANLGCNAAAADCVLQKQGIGAWTADSHSTGQGSCGT